MASEGYELATAYVTLLPSLRGAQASIARQLGAVDVSASGRSMGARLSSAMGEGIGTRIADALNPKGIAERLSGVASSAKSAFASVKTQADMAKAAIASVHTPADALRLGLGAVGTAAKGAGGLVVKQMNLAGNATRALVSAAQDAASKMAPIGEAVGKGLLAGAGSAALALGTLGTSAVAEYADFEQNVGGVQKLFGDAADYVVTHARNAYQTAGVDQNTYMEQVTSFSASLIQSLGGDTVAAAEYANRALVDMSDNVNTYGSNMEDVQNAYQGFAKQNYTMLDNLKLGYGGTQEEMQRLISDASQMTDVQAELGVTVDGTSMSFGNIVNAISVMQKSMGIAGTTSREAATTISGSIGMMKAAWTNWQSALAEPDGAVEEYTQDLVESFGAVLDNVIPAVQRVFDGVTAALPVFMEGLSATLAQWMPTILQTATDGLTSIGTAVAAFLPQLAQTLVEWAPSLVESAATVIEALLASFQEQFPTIVETISAALPQIIETLTSFFTESVPVMVDLGLQLFVALIDNLGGAMGTICAALPEIVTSITDTLLAHIGEIIDAGVRLLSSLADNLPAVISALVPKMPEIVSSLVQAFVEHLPDFVTVGAQLLAGIGKGIVGAIPGLISSAISACQGVVSSVLGFFGIHSPSKVFAEIGDYCMQGMGVGFEDGADGARASLLRSSEEVMQGARLGAVKAGFDASRYVGKGVAGGVTYVTYVDGARVNDDEAMRQVTRDFVTEAVRKGGF